MITLKEKTVKKVIEEISSNTAYPYHKLVTEVDNALNAALKNRYWMHPLPGIDRQEMKRASTCLGIAAHLLCERHKYSVEECVDIIKSKCKLYNISNDLTPGIIGNLFTESRFNNWAIRGLYSTDRQSVADKAFYRFRNDYLKEVAYNDPQVKQSFGIAQWTDERLILLCAWKDKDGISFDSQVDWLLGEITRTYVRYVKQFLNKYPTKHSALVIHDAVFRGADDTTGITMRCHNGQALFHGDFDNVFSSKAEFKKKINNIKRYKQVNYI